MKTVGIIGGMGAEATIDLFTKIVKNTQVKKDQDHVHVIIDNDARIPDRSHFILTGNNNPKDHIISAGKRLESVKVDYIAMPCNTAHYFYNDLKENIGVPIIHMIEETAKYAKKKRMKSVLLLATKGTYESGLYNLYFSDKTRLLEPNEILKERIHSLIYSYKQKGRVDKKVVDEIHTQLYSLDVDAIILGCTELPLIFEGDKYLDPTLILAKACIKKAGHKLA